MSLHEAVWLELKREKFSKLRECFNQSCINQPNLVYGILRFLLLIYLTYCLLSRFLRIYAMIIMAWYFDQGVSVF